MDKPTFDMIYRFNASTEPRRSRQQFANHSVVIVTGGVFFSHDDDGDIQEAGPGDVLYFRPGLGHDSWNDPQRPTRCLRLTFAAPGSTANWPKTLPDTDGRIRILGQWLMHAQQTRPPTARDVCDRYLQAMCAEIDRLLAQPEDSLVRRVHGYALQRLHQRLTLDDLAQHVGLSRYHFLRRYKASTGETPMRMIQHLRLQEARRQIISTRLPLKTIAKHVGLTDECHLSRLLRQHFGCSSRELRAAGTASWETLAPHTTRP